MRRRAAILHQQNAQDAKGERGQDPAGVLAKRDAEGSALVVGKREPNDVAEDFVGTCSGSSRSAATCFVVQSARTRSDTSGQNTTALLPHSLPSNMVQK